MKKNNIDRLMDSNGCWKHDKDDICKVSWEYFHNLFISTVPSNDELNLSFIDKCITEDINSRLARDIIDKEILEDFNQMNPRKVLRIDGLSSCFLTEI
ncbi:hypothetical protein PVK06_004875 [Gossypium arboreum]|uniref:Uncharacterized protein n=1 Tax=Gossypium arboreum TaxID=29729 RepID=A0ABR0QU68_GOSAR|nr:hypothetical protein PVK06_004875 [Gossypium arboreum]